MKSFRAVIKTLTVIVVIAPLAAVGFAWSGLYNVAATDTHLPVTHWLLETTVRRSVARHADGIAAPKLGAREQWLAGINDYEAMCAGCHTPPGGAQSAMAKGMYPSPPDLARSAEHMDAAELFWVTKHGIKASGMPAWGLTHDDEALWHIVALLKQFPDMTGERYQKLKGAAKRHGGHHGRNDGDDNDAHSHGGDQRVRENQGGESGREDHHASEQHSNSSDETRHEDQHGNHKH
ncbi:c-type cytochrome [Algiphilus aromaticivorans]|jgi:mono/diheme cytochrome c family protein|uniref:c-type cytochrome n=1 Tax=Algiphilus aromaticivorans TaxID=382454 RepID=UPI0006944E75|nr:cytochrome c [Algiphilus aromaticivorans]